MDNTRLDEALRPNRGSVTQPHFSNFEQLACPLLHDSTHRMSGTAVFLLLLSWPLFASSRSLHGRTPSPLNIAARGKNVPPLGFYDPRDHGGSWLTVRASVPLSSPVVAYLDIHAL